MLDRKDPGEIVFDRKYPGPWGNRVDRQDSGGIVLDRQDPGESS